MRPVPAWVPALTLAATVGQLAVAEFVPGIDRFANKAFGARLVLSRADAGGPGALVVGA